MDEPFLVKHSIAGDQDCNGALGKVAKSSRAMKILNVSKTLSIFRELVASQQIPLQKIADKIIDVKEYEEVPRCVR